MVAIKDLQIEGISIYKTVCKEIVHLETQCSIVKTMRHKAENYTLDLAIFLLVPTMHYILRFFMMTK